MMNEFNANDVADDAVQHHSSEMNPAAYGSAQTSENGVKVLFLGNSITLHSALASIGWSGNWGMAASAAEKDYVHLVAEGIRRETGREVDLRVRNIALLERDYRNVVLADLLKEDADYEPDYLIVAIGENVPNFANDDDAAAYRAAVANLLAFFHKGRQVKARTVVRGCFWPNAAKDKAMAEAASDYAAEFVRCDISGENGMMATGLFAHEGVAAHPGDRGMEEIARRILAAFFPKEAPYRVWADGRECVVHPIRVSAMPFNQWAPGYQRPMDQIEDAAYVALETDGETVFLVNPKRTFTKAVVRPLSAGVVPVVDNGAVIFTLPKCGHYVLELDDYHTPLQIFAEPKRDFAREKAEATITFGPGLHEPEIVKLKSHDRVYIDKDAVVMGSFQADGVEDVKISGYGVICGSRNRRDNDHCYREFQSTTVRLIDSSDIVVDGPIVTDSSCWCVEAFNCRNVEISHVKVTGQWRYNTDGIDICNSTHVRIHDSFVHSFDDTIVLKGLPDDCDKPVKDIEVRRCVLWCGWGRTLEIGLETWAAEYSGILFEDCDLIHNNMGALSIHLGGDAPVKDVTFRRLRLEYAAGELRPELQTSRDGKYTPVAPWSGPWFTATNWKFTVPNWKNTVTGETFDAFAKAHQRFGNFDLVKVEDIDITVEDGARLPVLEAFACEEGDAFGTIEMANVRLNGTPVAPLSAFPCNVNAKGAAGLVGASGTDWMRGKVGAFVHFLVDEDGFRRLDEFDVEGLAGQLQEMKADYFIITLGQNSGWYCAPNATYEKLAGYAPHSHCSRRDIPAEIIAALKGTGIRFGLYLPCQTPNRDQAAARKFGFPVEEGKISDYPFTDEGSANWARVIEEWSRRYGRDISIWWFDGGYSWCGFGEAHAARYKAAVLAGNPDAAFAFNPGVRMERNEESGNCWAGEENEPFDVIPDSRWKYPGVQWQVLTFMGRSWGDPECRFSDEAWGKWIKAVTEKGGAVTIDMNISRPFGKICAEQVAQFKRVTDARF